MDIIYRMIGNTFMEWHSLFYTHVNTYMNNSISHKYDISDLFLRSLEL